MKNDYTKEGVRQVYTFSFYNYVLSTPSRPDFGVYPVFVLKKANQQGSVRS